ncbi:MAG: cyclic nucleotide-binding domain-containing protein, partial [Campylobacterota bacterium]|nr:cyclic nucleotide-binding domain-containing protein [Campylobacterota bacterium]
IKYRVRYWTSEFLKQHHTRTKLVITIINHLYQAGITPLYHPRDVFITDMKDKSIHDIKDILSRCAFFKVFTESELDILSSFSNRVFKPMDSVIVEEEQDETSLFVIIEGLAKVTINNEDGSKEYIRTITAGDIFGEFSLLTGEKYFVTITAITDIVLYEIKDENIRPILEQRPAVVKDLSNMLTKRRLGKKCFAEIARKKGKIVLEEAALTKKISQDMSKLFLSLFNF